MVLYTVNHHGFCNFKNMSAKIIQEKFDLPPNIEISVIERLRSSKQLSDASSKASGKRDGRDWAQYTADTIELQRLEQTFESEPDWYYSEPVSTYSSAEKFFFIIVPNCAGNRDAAKLFWERVASECKPTELYVLHFAYGAFEFWRAVKEFVLL